MELVEMINVVRKLEPNWDSIRLGKRLSVVQIAINEGLIPSGQEFLIEYATKTNTFKDAVEAANERAEEEGGSPVEELYTLLWANLINDIITYKGA